MISSFKQTIREYPLLFILMLAALVRILFLFAFPVPMPAGGFGVYDTVAQYFAAGEGFGLLKHIQPGWPAVLGWVYTIFGRSATAIYGFQIFIGTLMVYGIYRLTLYNFRTRRMALFAAAISSTWPMFVFTTAQYGGTNNLLFATALLFAVYYLVRSVNELTVFPAVMSGLLFGFTAWIDVAALYLPVIVIGVLVIYMYFQGNGGSGVYKPLIIPTVVFMVFALVVGSWTYRNSLVFDTYDPKQEIRQQFPHVASPGKDKITIVAKDKEKKVLDQSFWKQVLNSRFASAAEELQQMVTFPYSLRYLTPSGTTISYKQELQNFLYGKGVSSAFQWSVALEKIVLTLLHWAFVVFSLRGLWRLRYKCLGVLTAAILFYTVGVTIITKLASSSVITPGAYFSFQVTPLLMIAGAYPLWQLFEDKTDINSNIN